MRNRGDSASRARRTGPPEGRVPAHEARRPATSFLTAPPGQAGLLRHGGEHASAPVGAPEALTVKMGDRLYQKDELLYPRLNEKDLDADPWGLGEPIARYRVA